MKGWDERDWRNERRRRRSCFFVFVFLFVRAFYVKNSKLQINGRQLEKRSADGYEDVCLEYVSAKRRAVRGAVPTAEGSFMGLERFDAKAT